MLELGVVVRGSVVEEGSALVEIVEKVEAARSVGLDESNEDTPEEGSVLVEIVEVVEAARSVELDKSDEGMLEEGSVVGLEELVEELKSDEPNKSTEDVLEARSLLAEFEESVGLDESADAVLKRLSDDEESISVLNTLEILVLVELI